MNCFRVIRQQFATCGRSGPTFQPWRTENEESRPVSACRIGCSHFVTDRIDQHFYRMAAIAWSESAAVDLVEVREHSTAAGAGEVPVHRHRLHQLPLSA